MLWQVGRTGVITPRAVIEPTRVGGTTVEFVTLHNPDDLARKGFMLGDRVWLSRAGEVIPKLESPVVTARDGSQRPIVTPAVCPECGGPVDSSQARIRCAQRCARYRLLAYACSRDALDVDGLGTKQIEALVQSGSLNDLSDLFSLTEDDLVRAGVNKTANKVAIVDLIAAAKKQPLSRVLTALGIEGTGRSLCRSLARHFGSLDALAAAGVDELMLVDKIGAVKAEMIREQLDDLIDSGLLAGLATAGVNLVESSPAAAADTADLPLSGKTIVVTGSMSGALAGSRTEVTEKLEALGAKVSGSVSARTTILVCGAGGGSKRQAAEKLGTVEVLDEEQFAASYLR